MTSFDDFILSGANIMRYVPIRGNAAGIIGLYRKARESIALGQVPLFLLDGEPTSSLLNRAIEKLQIKVYIIIYRPFDTKIKKKYEDLSKNMRSAGFFKKDGSIANWAQENLDRLETEQNEFVKKHLINTIQPYLNYINAKREYEIAVAAPIIDADTRQEITADLNEYLYEKMNCSATH